MNGQKPPLSTRAWIAIFAVLLACCAAAWFLLVPRSAGSLVGVYENGKLVRKVDLAAHAEPYEIVLTGWGNSVVRVEAGAIYMYASDCPDQLCVAHGSLNDGLPIVCVPNRVVIRYLAETDKGYDAVSGARAAD